MAYSKTQQAARLRAIFQQHFGAKYTILQELQAGGDAVVLKCRQSDNTALVVAKVIDLQRHSPHRLDELQTTINCMHPGVVEVLKGVNIDERTQLIVTPFAPVGSLESFFQELTPRGDLIAQLAIPEELRLKTIKQILLTLSHIHRRGVVHMDLKPGNIIITSETPWTVKVIDFGLASRPGIVTSYGTVGYRAPESYYGGSLVSPVHTGMDLWALGVIILQMNGYVAGCRSPPEFFNTVYSGGGPYWIENGLYYQNCIGGAFQHHAASGRNKRSMAIAAQLLNHYPHLRLTADQALERWFTEEIPRVRERRRSMG